MNIESSHIERMNQDRLAALEPIVNRFILPLVMEADLEEMLELSEKDFIKVMSESRSKWRNVAVQVPEFREEISTLGAALRVGARAYRENLAGEAYFK